MDRSDFSSIPMLHLPDDKNRIVDFISETIGKAGKSAAVIGLSGGIDSAVVAHLSAEALGAENVYAVMMPYRLSNPASLADASKVIDQLGCQSREVDISPMCDPYISKYVGDNKLRQGNIFARIRMIVLYDISAEVDGLVVGTGNKTELYLGYSTQYGDAACGLAPIGDLYKTHVRQVAQHLRVHPDIIAKPPSADLWQGQTDEGELGITYDEVDRLLHHIVDMRANPYHMIKAGYDPEKVEGVMERIEKNEFKRLPPPICQITG